MSVTDLRDQQNAEWHAWAERDPDRAREHNAKRRDELADEAAGGKVRACAFVDGHGVPCGRKHHAKGYCTGHYRQVLQEGRATILLQDRPPRLCDFGGCGRKHTARGLCDSHYRQWKAGEELRPIRPAHRSPGVPGARTGEPWSEAEFDLVMSGIPLDIVARRLGRTYSSVVRARQRRRKMLGLGIAYLKTDSDPYDGSSRAGVLYMKDNS